MIKSNHACRNNKHRGGYALRKEWFLEKQCNTVAVDEAAAGLIADLKNNSVPAKGAKGKVFGGITSIQDRLKIQGDGLPRLTVAPSCINTINEFESYVWKPEKDEPIKENDHAMDAIRYFADALVNVGWWMSRGET